MQRTFILITVLILITAGLVVFALQTPQNKKPVPQTTKVTVQPTPAADTILRLSPESVQFSASGSGSVSVLIDSGYNTISGVQLELAYDPKVLSQVTVSKGTFLDNPIIMLDQNDKQTGRISYALAITPAGKQASGTGTVAVISFKKAPGAVGTQTMLTLLDKSLVTMLGIQGSVLRETSGATVLLSPALLPKQVVQPNNVSTNGAAPSKQ